MPFMETFILNGFVLLTSTHEIGCVESEGLFWVLSRRLDTKAIVSLVHSASRVEARNFAFYQATALR